jgi:hypothetical protein
MIELLKEIILDFQEVELVPGVPRRVNVKPVAGKATGCIGVRRSGKSTFMFQLMQRLLDSGVARQNILYLNFFDDRLHGLQHERLGVILEAYLCTITILISELSGESCRRRWCSRSC